MHQEFKRPTSTGNTHWESKGATWYFNKILQLFVTRVPQELSPEVFQINRLVWKQTNKKPHTFFKKWLKSQWYRRKSRRLWCPQNQMKKNQIKRENDQLYQVLPRVKRRIDCWILQFTIFSFEKALVTLSHTAPTTEDMNIHWMWCYLLILSQTEFTFLKNYSEGRIYSSLIFGTQVSRSVKKYQW